MSPFGSRCSNDCCLTWNGDCNLVAGSLNVLVGLHPISVVAIKIAAIWVEYGVTNVSFCDAIFHSPSKIRIETSVC